MILKRLAIAASALVLLVILLVGAAAAWLATADLHGFVERKATESLGRQVSIASLHIAWGMPLSLDIHGLKIANAAWGSKPDMVTIDHLFALIDVKALLHGVLRYQRLDVTKPVILLERDAKGVGNWKFGSGGGGGGGSIGPFALVPKNRSQFPTLIDFTLQDGQITYRTASQPLVIDLKKVAIATPDDDQPVTLTADGAYNGMPALLKAGTDSFVVLRQTSTPFGTAFSIANDTSAINFKGTMMLPLDFDGIDGAMTIATKKVGELLKAFDAGFSADFPASLAGAFTRNGDDWKLEHIKGDLAGETLTGSLELLEGPRGGSDHMKVTSEFPALDLDRLTGGGKATKSDPRDTALDLPAKGSPDIAAHIVAHTFKSGKIQLSEVVVTGEVGPGKVALDELNFALAGTTLQARLAADGSGKSTHVRASAALLGADIVQLSKILGATTNQIAGKLDARADLEMTGATLRTALGTSNGHAVVVMTGGTVSRDLLEKAATDLRTLFRKGEGMSRVDCLLAVAVVKSGVATLSPVKLRTPDATLVGGGKIDLRSGTLDLMVKSEPKSTGFFALDIPLHLSGSFSALSAKPASDSGLGDSAALPELPPAMAKLAQSAACQS